MLFRHQEEKKINLEAENIRCLEIKKELVQQGGCKAMCDLAQTRTFTVLKYKFNLCFKTKSYLGFE